MLQSPFAVAVDPTHRVFVLDAGSRSVHVFDFGRNKYELMSGGDRLQSPAGIAADEHGNVYVTDRNSRSVLVFDARREVQSRIDEDQATNRTSKLPGALQFTIRVDACTFAMRREGW